MATASLVARSEAPQPCEPRHSQASPPCPRKGKGAPLRQIDNPVDLAAIAEETQRDERIVRPRERHYKLRAVRKRRRPTGIAAAWEAEATSGCSRAQIIHVGLSVRNAKDSAGRQRDGVGADAT